MDLVLYGCGRRCEILLSLLKDSSISVLKVVDSNKEKWGTVIEGIEVGSPDELSDFLEGYVCVTFYSTKLTEPTWTYLESIGFSKDRIISFHDVLQEIYKNNFEINFQKKESQFPKTIFDGSWPMKLGGVENWLRTIVPALNEHGEAVYLATEKGMCLSDSTQVLDFCLYDTPCFSKEYIQKCIMFLQHNLPCALVFSRVDELLLAASIVKRQYPNSIRIVMTDHGSCDGMCRDILSYKESIDYYMCVSTGIRDILVGQGIDEHRVEVMTCPIVYPLNISRTYTDDAKQPLKLAFGGRLEIFEKRIDILQNLILELEDGGVNYQLDIAGDGSQYDALAEFICAHGLDRRVFLLGKLSNSQMQKFWKNHDIALNTSDNEGRPLANMEAMANGTVPIVTETIGAVEDVVDGVNGFVVPINDAVKMAEKIMYLDGNRQLLKCFGEKARMDILQKLSLSKHVEQWSCLLKKVW